ncbi:hypothetical protein IQ22_02669 [Pseudomonas duriflava]|uniref:Class I SAM-dependent methyltransferase n=1 Tax=Pseudomonas duriflava TaxID=459528 RepID=A0A562Q9R6_9PSED|nr:class I SAM-dependent methyltransferase [Pseudomonas duriflava]TWI53453.1 hypothetical protein IQ22_02669 [Pseudomonas duriflava]
MTHPYPLFRLAPITHGALCSSPRILLGGLHQPTLLRYLDGWPKRWPLSRSFQIRFALQYEELRQFDRDAFDFAVIEAPTADTVTPVIHELVRVARQGIITRRQG